VDLDPGYLALGSDPKERQARYRRWVAEAIPRGEWQLIRDAVQRGQLTGSPRFVEQVQQRIGRRLVQRGRGRPRQSKK
jgi:putative transposase